ncbi:RNA polymerase sigma factor [Saccharicrinis aurantiacus]|uniref:RNA polymerase sigma factor n=1 Tax=Saccharicrinis aurantiacus TaxID=1849719 RepID=UPI0024916777|nr:RNA polymerase sigma factor [Saccharicrinis aurantiacus]
MIFKTWRNKRKSREELFDELYHRHASVFRGVCRRYAQSFSEADDILQEAYIKIYHNLNQLKDISSFEAWGKRIVINTALKQIRDTKKLQEVSIDQINFDVSDEEEQIVMSSMAELDISELIVLMQDLPDGYRTILNLYAVEGYSHKEISEMLQIKEASSRSQYFKAKKAFQHILLEKATKKGYDKFAV